MGPRRVRIRVSMVIARKQGTHLRFCIHSSRPGACTPLPGFRKLMNSSQRSGTRKKATFVPFSLPFHLFLFFFQPCARLASQAEGLGESPVQNEGVRVMTLSIRLHVVVEQNFGSIQLAAASKDLMFFGMLEMMTKGVPVAEGRCSG